MLISIEITSLNEGNFSAERIKNFGTRLFVVLAETFDACLHHKETYTLEDFFRNHTPYHITDMRLCYLQNMSIYYPSGK